MKSLLIQILLVVGVVSATAQTFTLQGRVTDEQGNPVELATVSCLKQGKVVLTSLKGEYQMQLLSQDSVVVRFSMVGYKTKTRVLRNPRGKQTLQIQLFDDDYQLDEVTVTEKKRQTGTTQNIDVKDMKAAPIGHGQCRGGDDTAAGWRIDPQRDVVAIQCARRQFRRELCIY